MRRFKGPERFDGREAPDRTAGRRRVCRFLSYLLVTAVALAVLASCGRCGSGFRPVGDYSMAGVHRPM